MQSSGSVELYQHLGGIPVFYESNCSSKIIQIQFMTLCHELYSTINPVKVQIFSNEQSSA